jgi:hypothetical protein
MVEINYETSEVVQFRVREIRGNVVTLDMRFRGEKNWVHVEGIRVFAGDTISLYDGQDEEVVDLEWIERYYKVPRSE